MRRVDFAWRPRLRLSFDVIFVAVVLAFVLAGVARAAEESSADSDCAIQIAERVQARYESIRDLEASFEQTTQAVSLGVSPLAGNELRRGRVVLAKPGRMRWSYEEPEPSLVVSDGETLWLYDPAAQEVQRLSVSQGYLNGAALQFLMGDGKLLEHFRVSARRCQEEVVDLELVPRQDASFERLGLRARSKDGEIVETRIVDLFGNVTRVSFQNLRTNRGPAPETFRFEAPPHTRVLDLTEHR